MNKFKDLVGETNRSTEGVKGDQQQATKTAAPAENMVEVGKTDFDFYAKFAKPLILSLNCTEDRILAAAWFSKLRDETSGPDKLRLDYLKLLLFVLQRHRLVGPFSENPNAKEKLEEFGEDYELAAVARQIIEKDQKERREHYLKKIKGETGDCPPFSTDFSSDLREYVAAQDIPNFGVHVFYAISQDPILDWDNSHHAVLPRAVKRMEPHGHISETSFAVMEPRPETPDEAEKCKILEETGVMPDESIFTGGRRRARERKSPFGDIDRPAPPLGILPGEGEDELLGVQVPPPTWGSNLIEVREPIDMEDAGTPEAEVSPGPSAADMTTGQPTEKELDAEDPEIVKLLETSFNMEDILAEVDAMETEEPRGYEATVDPLILEEERKFKEMEADLDRHDATIAEALAALDDDERRMLMEMEAEEAAGLAPKPKPSPGKEVKVVADEDTVIKVLVETPEAVTETREEKARKDAKAAEDKKKKPAGRTGLNKSKAKGAILKKGEKKELEEQEKNAKVVDTKTGVPGSPTKRPGVPKTKQSKVKISAAVSEGEIPSEKPSKTDKGKSIPGKDVPKKRGIPKRGAAKQPPVEGTAEMQEMKERLEKKLQETKETYPEKFEHEQMAGGIEASEPMPEDEEGPRRRTPLDDIANIGASGSPEADDIYDETDREFEIMERLYELYEQLSPEQPEGLRTPPVFSKHTKIREMGQKLRYKPEQFGVQPSEEFRPGPEYFEGQEPGSPFVDPRLVDRRMRPFTPPIETPPFAKMEELKKMMESADRSLEASPAISGNVGVTTPKSPSTPRRPVRRDLRAEFDMESPPQFESPPPSPEAMPTPEFLKDPGWGLPKALTKEMIEEMYQEKVAEHEAYIQAEMEEELSRWPILQPQAPSPAAAGPPEAPGPSPPRLPSPQAPAVSGTPPSPQQPTTTPPQQRVAPRAPTPPSVGGPGTIPRTPGTPSGLPPDRRFRYETPPKFRPQAVIEPGSPEFEQFDPLQHEDIIYQTMPDLVEAEIDDFDHSMASPQFELKDWYDPMQAILEQAAEEDNFGMMDFDAMPEDALDEDIELEPFEEDYRQYSPVITLQERLKQHEIPKEFYDPTRPQAKSKTVRVGDRKVKIPRSSRPTKLAQEVIEEDYSGELSDKHVEEEMIKAEEEEFLNMSLGDPDRAEYMKKMAEEAQEVEPPPPQQYDIVEPPTYGYPTPPPPEVSPQRSPERPPRPPSPPVETPPMAPSRFQLLYGRTPPDYDEGLFEYDEPDFLASPGMPSPEPPPTPEPAPPSPPWAPPPEAFWVDDIFEEDEGDFLVSSPGLPPGRTVADEVGAAIKLPPPSWQLSPEAVPPAPAVPVHLPIGPPDRPVGPSEMMMAPGRRTPSPPRRARPAAPIGSPEFDPIALKRHLISHRVDFAKKDEFEAGRGRVKRRTPIPRRYFPIREHAGYEESEKYQVEVEDYREMMSRLPHVPQTAEVYPEDLMGEEREGRFPMTASILDEPLSPTGRQWSPIQPQRELHGWSTPPHLRIKAPPRHPFAPPSPPRQPDIFMQLAPHVRDRLRPEQRGEGLFDLREEDVLPEELLYESYGSPGGLPGAMQSPGGVAIPTMTMDQQMSLAEDRAQWQAQQIISPRKSPGRPSPSPRTSPRQPSPQISQPMPRMPSPVSASKLSPPKSQPCSRPPEPSPKILKRVQETSFSSGVYDPESPEDSRRWKRGRTMLEFNRPEDESVPRRPVVTPPSQGVAVYSRGPPISAPVSPTPMAMPAPAPMPSPRAMPQRRIPRRVVRPQQPGATPRREGGRLPRRNILAGEGGMPVRRRLFEDFEPSPQQAAGPSPGSPTGRPCPGVPQEEKVEIVEEYEETEMDYIPEHLRGYKWMDVEEPDPYYAAFRQQFR